MTQTEAILGWLKAGHSLTPLEALERFGCLRAAARVKELREAGHPIESKFVKQGRKRFARYVYAGPVQRELFR